MQKVKLWARAALIATFVIGAASRAEADAIGSVEFSAGSQSFWGPGKSAASLDEGGRAGISILGKNVGVGFNVDASSGTVSGNYGGKLSLLGAGTHDLADGLFSLDSAFDATSGTLSTKFGASLDVFAYVEGIVTLSFPGFPKGNNLNTSGSINRELGVNRNFSGFTNLDLNAFDIWVLSAGATFKVTQASSFKARSITGTLTARHAGTGATQQRSYTIGDAIDLNLGRTGFWDLSLSSLRLANTFKTGFDGAIGGFIDPPGARKEITTKNFNLFDTSSFGLSFGAADWGRSMRVQVTDSSGIPTEPVPEPGTLVLFGAVGAFVAYRRVRRR